MKRTTSRTLFLLVVVEQTHEDAPSSRFPAAPVADDKPGLARTQPTSGEIFPWARKAASK
jgi:hypothetical protein